MSTFVTPTLAPRNFSELSSTQQTYYCALSEYKAPFLEEKLRVSGEMADAQTYASAFTEFKKFTALSRTYRQPLAMPSKPIDTLWHQFILFTREYVKFSEEFNGTYLHHDPNIPSRVSHGRASLDNLLTLYTRTFGPMPEIWGVRTTAQQTPTLGTTEQISKRGQ